MDTHRIIIKYFYFILKFDTGVNVDETVRQGAERINQVAIGSVTFMENVDPDSDGVGYICIYHHKQTT